MLQLLIEMPHSKQRMQIYIDETTTVGTSAADLAARLGYPTVDAAGRPIAYQFRLASGNQLLPNTFRFLDISIASGTQLRLEASKHPPQPRPTTSLFTRSWRRRSLLTLGGLGIACLGLGMGVSAAFAQHYFAMPDALSNQTEPQAVHVQFTFSGHHQAVRSVKWSPDGSLLASGADDSQLLVWSPDGTILQHVAHAAPVLSLDWSPESHRLVSGSGNTVTFLAALAGTVLAQSTHHTGLVTSVAWATTNQMQVVSGGQDKQVVIWETGPYRAQNSFISQASPITAVSWGSDGQTVASAALDGSIHVWNANNAQEVHSKYQDTHLPMRACSFAPSGSLLAAGGDDGIIRLWDGFLCQQQGPTCQDPPLRLSPSHHSPIRSLAWSPTGRYLASGDDEGGIILWSPSQKKTPLRILIPQSKDPVMCLAWSPNGKQMASVRGHMVDLWLIS